MPNGNDISSNSKLLKLHDSDNIAVLKESADVGTLQLVDGVQLTIQSALTMGHKVAVKPIAVGESVLKYGAKIGKASAKILPGEHVHLHNLESDYTVIEDMDA